MSHGCIHVGKKGADSMLKWATHKTRIVITREHCLLFVYYDLIKAGYRENKNIPAHIRAYLKKMAPVQPHKILLPEGNAGHAWGAYCSSRPCRKLIR